MPHFRDFKLALDNVVPSEVWDLALERARARRKAARQRVDEVRDCHSADDCHSLGECRAILFSFSWITIMLNHHCLWMWLVQVAGRLKEKEDETAPLERQLTAAAGRAAAWDTSRSATLGRLGAERARLETKAAAVGGLDAEQCRSEVFWLRTTWPSP